MIDIKQDYKTYFTQVSRIAKGEKVEIYANYATVRQIVESSGFYAVPFFDFMGRFETNKWLLSLEKIKVGVVSNSKREVEMFIQDFCFSKRDYECYYLISCFADTNSCRYDMLGLEDESKKDLFAQSKVLLNELYAIF